MKKLLLIGILCSYLNSHGQKDSTTDFKNAGEQEKYWTSEKFRTEYKKESYNRYFGPITVLNKTTYKYNTQIFIVTEPSKAIRQMFTLGILYPSLIALAGSGDSLTDGQSKFKNPFQSDTIGISNIEELTYLQISPQVKRFNCWVRLSGLANPLVYLFELTNEHATQQTSIEDFIKGASLTFFRQGWVII